MVLTAARGCVSCVTIGACRNAAGSLRMILAGVRSRTRIPIESQRRHHPSLLSSLCINHVFGPQPFFSWLNETRYTPSPASHTLRSTSRARGRSTGVYDSGAVWFWFTVHEGTRRGRHRPTDRRAGRTNHSACYLGKGSGWGTGAGGTRNTEWCKAAGLDLRLDPIGSCSERGREARSPGAGGGGAAFDPIDRTSVKETVNG